MLSPGSHRWLASGAGTAGSRASGRGPAADAGRRTGGAPGARGGRASSRRGGARSVRRVLLPGCAAGATGAAGRGGVLVRVEPSRPELTVPQGGREPTRLYS